MKKPNPYLLLVGAIISSTPTLRGTQVSVSIGTDPIRSCRVLFPNSQFINGGAGNLWATRWIIERKNDELKRKGEMGGIRTDPTRALFI